MVLGLGYLAYSLFIGNETNYLTVSELKSQAEVLNNEHVMVEGRVVPGSIDWDDKAKIMKFVLTDDKESLGIVYQGIVPDNFKPGANLVVVGKYSTDGVFEALGFGSGNSFCNTCH